MTTVAPAQPERPAAMRFFLEEAPPAVALSTLPSSASRVFIAKVRILSLEQLTPARWWPLEPGETPPVLPPYRVRTEIEVTALIAGANTWRRRQRVEFARTDSDIPWMVPLPLERDSGELFVISFFDAQGSRTLLGFPVSDEAYSGWRQRLNEPFSKPPIR